MNKLVKFITSLSIVAVLSTAINVQAYTEEDNSMHNEILSSFPDLKERLELEGYSEIVSEEKQYLKFTPNEGNSDVPSEENYSVKEVTAKEYNDAKAQSQLEERMNLGKSSLERGYSEEDFTWNTGGDSYLALNIVSYRSTTDKYKFKAIAEYCWLKIPFVTLTDALGISVGENMKIYANTYESQSTHAYLDPSDNNYIVDIRDNTSFYHNDRGVATKVDIWGGGGEERGYLSCVIGFTQYISEPQSSSVFANYVHTKVGFSGSLSLTSAGKPDLALNLTQSDYSIAADTYVNK